MVTSLEATVLVKGSVDQFERYDGRQLAHECLAAEMSMSLSNTCSCAEWHLEAALALGLSDHLADSTSTGWISLAE